MSNADWLGPVVELVYDAAIDDDKWRSIAPAIAGALGSTSAVFKTCGGDGAPQLESVTDNLRVTSRERSWSEYWHRNDLWVERASQLDMGEVFTNQRLMPDAQFERTGFYQDWTRKLEIYHMVGVLFPVGYGEVGVLGAHRPKGASAFTDADRRQLAALFPHVRHALDMRHRLRGAALAQHAALRALEHLETGVVVVDASCTVLFANCTAERILGAARGIGTRNRRLVLDDAELNRRLAKLARDAAQLAGSERRLPGGAIALARPDRLPITLLVSPWRAEWAPGDVAHPAAMIFVRDPEASPPAAAQTLVELFGMTKAEAVVALAIGEGKSLDQVAADQGVGLGTVRTHLKRALFKTGTSRQGALAALVCRSVAGISGQK